MATVPRQRLSADGFRVEAQRGLVGWVEETWLGPDAEAAALALRTLDGQRALLLADDVVSILGDEESVVVRPGARLLELGAPRVDQAPPVHASWSTTGATIEPPTPPGLLRRAALARRPWRLAPPPAGHSERPLWQIALLLYAAIAVLAALFMLAAFTIAAALS